MTLDTQLTSPDVLEKILSDAITQVRTYEQPPGILAHAIMVAIQTEVARMKSETLVSLARAMRVPI